MRRFRMSTPPQILTKTTRNIAGHTKCINGLRLKLEPKSSPGARYVVVGEGEDGQRIDNFLLRELKGVPRSVIYRILRRGEVRVDGGRVKPEHRLQTGERVRVPPVRVDPEGAAPA